ncbi:insulinase family protein [Novosphingobium sp. PS1R-30]|uniref:Insulinase family protein n=1 Tax=Novosphingobium anseongense TaxID=3133436 RepID=A0ABU8RRA2_9SPHN
MRRNPSIFFFLLLSFALSACAQQAEQVASVSRPRPVWGFLESDIAPEEQYRFNRLPSGLRYVIRRNANPKGTAMVRMEIAAGSLDETPAERGFAHYVEHMAFNGSTNVKEGEMIRLLERNGLAFGADTNAATGFETTTYMLDLPRADPKLLDIALMLMRETASELTISPEAVDRERGVILSELRDRNTWQMRNGMDQAKFLHPQALYPDRFPVGTAETINAATAQSLRAFWEREYVPEHATVIVIGDFDPAVVEKAILAKFGSWQAKPVEPAPQAGPVDVKAAGRTEVYVDPALSERITASRHGGWIDGPDTTAQRREGLLRQIGYAIVNRRLLRIVRQPDPPFRGAGFGTGDVFRDGRTTNLIVDTIDGKWRRGMIAAAVEYRRALRFGFSPAEVAEQVANIRTATRDAAASESTRSNGALMGAVFDLLRNDVVPGSPQGVLDRLEAFIPQITPEAVQAAMQREAIPLEKPLLRFQGRRQPEGGEKAIRSAWNEAMRAPLAKGAEIAAPGFAYSVFGTPGTILSDTREAALGIREVRFTNGVRLNLKKTDIDKDRILVQVSVDGGDMLNTRDNPLATQMVSALPVGGLGKHSQDDLQSILAGHTVSTGISSTPETFVASAQTTPRDLQLQLQVMAAFVTDAGYRPEGEIQYRLNINNFFAQRNATPNSALSNGIGGILSENDPRFTLQPVEAYRKLTFDKLKTDIGDRLAHGAIEIGIVGDIDEDQAIALVGGTFGAIAPREAEFKPYTAQRNRPFTKNEKPRVIRHTGPKDQALLRLTWPTRDDSDPVQSLTLELLERIVRIELTDTLREKLGKAYSPSAASTLSRFWKDYGVFGIAASVDVHEVPATRAAILDTIAELRAAPVSDDILQRARAPMIEAIQNGLKSNGGWLSLVDRAQTEPAEIDRYLQAEARLQMLTTADIQAMVLRYLDPKDEIEVLVLPEGVEEPK